MHSYVALVRMWSCTSPLSPVYPARCSDRLSYCAKTLSFSQHKIPGTNPVSWGPSFLWPDTRNGGAQVSPFRKSFLMPGWRQLASTLPSPGQLLEGERGKRGAPPISSSSGESALWSQSRPILGPSVSARTSCSLPPSLMGKMTVVIGSTSRMTDTMLMSCLDSPLR